MPIDENQTSIWNYDFDFAETFKQMKLRNI